MDINKILDGLHLIGKGIDVILSGINKNVRLWAMFAYAFVLGLYIGGSVNGY